MYLNFQILFFYLLINLPILIFFKFVLCFIFLVIVYNNFGNENCDLIKFSITIMISVNGDVVVFADSMQVTSRVFETSAFSTKMKALHNLPKDSTQCVELHFETTVRCCLVRTSLNSIPPTNKCSILNGVAPAIFPWLASLRSFMPKFVLMRKFFGIPNLKNIHSIQ